jgi:hypothetical protein
MFARPDGTLQVFWMDQFDGLTFTRWNGEVWSAAVTIPIMTTQQVEERIVSVPVKTMPSLTLDADGRAHAFWLGEPDRETELEPLMYGQLSADGTTWSTPRTVAESALICRVEVDPGGVLHLVYVRPGHSDASPAGIYYRRSIDRGVTWSTPQGLHGSIYYRLLSVEEAHLEVVAGGEGQVYVIWDDPRLEGAFYSLSTDGGLTWEEPQAVGDLKEGAKQAHVFLGQEGEALLFWKAIRGAGPCAFYQERAGERGTPQRVLEELAMCPEEVRFLRGANGSVLLVASGGGEGLRLAAWDGSAAQWSEPKWLSLSFEDPELDRQIYLKSLQATLAGEALAVVGQGQDGDVWFLESQMSALEWAFAPPSPWSESLALSQGEGLPGLPAIAIDAEGRGHVLWSEVTAKGLPGNGLYYAGDSGTRWTQPVEVLRSPDGKTEQPAVVAAGDQLHVVWSGGQSGEILYSRAYVRDAYAPDGWSEPQPLPAPLEVASAPAIVADLVGTLHVVYAVPLNERRGIYYTRSDDGGETWSEAQVVFNAAAVGWAMVDCPSLAVDEWGRPHVVWVRASLPGGGPPEGIYYAHLQGGGVNQDTEGMWSGPVEIADGAYDWPRVVATLTGQVHLLWGEANGSFGWTHQWSDDGGAGWTPPERVGQFAGVHGPVGLVGDGAGTLHLVGMGEDDAGETALLYTTWAGERWDDLETHRLSYDTRGEPGAAIALVSTLGRLHVTFREEREDEEGEAQMAVRYISRSVPVVEVISVSAFTPLPTMTPMPGATPMPTPTPRPAVNPEAPSPGPPSLSLGPLTLPLLSVGGILLAALLVVVVGFLALRPPWARRR